MRARVMIAASALAAIAAQPAGAGSIIVSANDGKAPMVDGAYLVDDPPLPDTLAIIDAAHFPPRILGQVEIEHSVAAPPFAVALSPDEKLALVGAGNHVDPNDAKKLVLDSFIQVVDTGSRPPKFLGRVQLAHQPIGVAINKAGTLALAAHYEGEVSVLKIDGQNVTLLGTVKLGDEKTRPAAVGFTPDGKHALVTKRGENTVAVLAVDGEKVTDTKQDITVGNNPYSIDVAPDGKFAAAANVGRGTPDWDSVTIIDLTREPFRAIAYAGVPPSPEGIAIAPNSQYLAVSSINGTNKAKDNPAHSDAGRLTLYVMRGDTPVKTAEARTGHNPQGVIFSPDSRFVLVQNYMEQELALYSFDGKSLKDTGRRVPMSARPAAIRAAAR